MIRWWRGAFLFLLLTMIFGVAGVFMWGKAQYESPSAQGEDVVLTVKKGMGLKAVSRLFYEAGLVDNPAIITVAVRLNQQHRKLKAGEYFLPSGISPKRAIAKIIAHDTITYGITIPEGLTVFEIKKLLNSDNRLQGEISAEWQNGQLLPETYQFVRGDARETIFKRMQLAMNALKEELWQQRQENLPFANWDEAITLAAIVERETAQDAERPKIASVFINRLRLNMPLQSDPTVIYALSAGKGQLDRPLTRKDWRFDHPYNTYRHKGLPPGAIAAPGRAAITAVLNPAKTDFLYFVANGRGGHSFAKSLRDHNRNVAKWKKFKRQAATN